METLEQLFNLQDLSGSFSATDVMLALSLSFMLAAFIGWIYKITHRGTSYTQSYVHTLVLMSMVVSVIMLIVGSNIARAFSLVGALSIIRFRNAMKETRDVGFIFFAMSIGMATGTKFYMLAVIATLIISLVIVIMTRLDWYSRDASGQQLVKIEVPNDAAFDTMFDDVMVRHTSASDLISVDSVRSGMLTELVYSVSLKKKASAQAFLSDVKKLNGNNKVTLITGYTTTDL